MTLRVREVPTRDLPAGMGPMWKFLHPPPNVIFCEKEGSCRVWGLDW